MSVDASGPELGWHGGPGGPSGPSGPHGSRSSTALLAAVLGLVALAGVVVGVVLTRGGGDDGSTGGGDDPGPAGDEMIADLAAGFYDRSDGVLTHEEAACTAESTVQGIGPDRLADLGMRRGEDELPFEDMAEGEQRRVATWMYDCIGDDRLVEYIVAIGPPERTYEQRSCFAEGQVRMLGVDRVRELWVEFTVHPETELFETLEDQQERDAMEVLEDDCYGPEAGTGG